MTGIDVERYRNSKGGFDKKTLAKLGVPWPPPKGWKSKLERGIPLNVKKKKNKRTKTAKNKIDRVKAFYRTYAWKKLRYEILALSGGECQLCGRPSGAGIVLNVDHIKPVRKYWELRLDPYNLQVLCSVCNHGKGNWDETDWRRKD